MMNEFLFAVGVILAAAFLLFLIAPWVGYIGNSYLDWADEIMRKQSMKKWMKQDGQEE